MSYTNPPSETDNTENPSTIQSAFRKVSWPGAVESRWCPDDRLLFPNRRMNHRRFLICISWWVDRTHFHSLHKIGPRLSVGLSSKQDVQDRQVPHSKSISRPHRLRSLLLLSKTSDCNRTNGFVILAWFLRVWSQQLKVFVHLHVVMHVSPLDEIFVEIKYWFRNYDVILHLMRYF